MEHPCAKCGALVRDGAPFCSSCRAPQIRVVIAGPEQTSVTISAHESAENPEPFPPILQSTGDLPVRPSRAETGGIQWSRALPCAAVGGVFSFLLSAIPFITFLAGGALAVILYQRRMKVVLRPGEGARLGAVSGGFGSFYFAITIIATLVYSPGELHKFFSAGLSQLSRYGYSQDTIQQMLDLLNSPSGLGSYTALWLFFTFVFLVAGSSIGGAWYSAWLRKRMRRR